MRLVDTSRIIAKLSPEAQSCLQKAAKLSEFNQNTEVSVPHFIYQMVQGKSNIVRYLLNKHGVSFDVFADALEAEIVDLAQSEPHQKPPLARSLVKLLSYAGLLACQGQEEGHISAEYIFLAFLLSLKKTRFLKLKRLFSEVNVFAMFAALGANVRKSQEKASFARPHDESIVVNPMFIDMHKKSLHKPGRYH